MIKRISPTVVEVDLEAVRYNYKQLKGLLPSSVKTLCVVKSNAYGHGAQRISKTLQDEGADYFGTGTLDEAVELREAGVKRPILALLGVFENQFEALVRYQLTPVLYDIETATKLNEFLTQSRSVKKRLPVHLKIDTGMTRLGVLPSQVDAFFKAIKGLNMLDPAGLMTHLAEADSPKVTNAQLKVFEEVRQKFDTYFPADTNNPKVFHVANSQAALDKRFGEGARPKEIDLMVRLGIALYGAYPVEKDKKIVNLKPVLSWKTKIVSLKDVPTKSAVSYKGTFVTKKPAKIAVIPVGYADGYPRSLSNQSHVLVRGVKAPVVGTICMDLMMIDVTAIPKVQSGDEVVLIGTQGKEEIRAEELADLAKTISYEIFCRISPRVPRVYR